MTNNWIEIYAGIYRATCDRCGKSGNGFFWILNGKHTNGTVCRDCYEKTKIKKEG